MPFLTTSTLGIFASGALAGAIAEWFYITRDVRTANGVRQLFTFSEKYGEFVQTGGKEPKFDDEYLVAVYKQAKGLIKEYKAPLNPSMLAAELAVCSKLGLMPSDAFQACLRSKARYKTNKHISN